MIRAYFFDLDGTLADTDRDIRESWKAALRDCGLTCPRFDALFIAGPSFDEMTQKLFPEQYTPELAQDLRMRFAEHYDHDGFPNTREYPQALAWVRRLKAAGTRVFIATNKRFAGAQGIARHFGWEDLFDDLYAGDMHRDDAIGVLRKPALLKLIMREHGLSPAECVMVGDTCNDFEAAAANGIRSIAVPWGYGTPEERAQANEIYCDPLGIAPDGLAV